MPEYPARKPNRLPGFDYAQNGGVFCDGVHKGEGTFPVGCQPAGV